MLAQIIRDIPTVLVFPLGVLFFAVFILVSGFVFGRWERRKETQFKKLRKILKRDQRGGIVLTVQGLQALANAEGITLWIAYVNTRQRNGIDVLYDPVKAKLTPVGF